MKELRDADNLLESFNRDLELLERAHWLKQRLRSELDKKIHNRVTIDRLEHDYDNKSGKTCVSIGWSLDIPRITTNGVHVKYIKGDQTQVLHVMVIYFMANERNFQSTCTSLRAKY